MTYSTEKKTAPLNALDRLIVQFDTALRTLNTAARSTHRASPTVGMAHPELSEEERRHAAGLMRINHTGEVCAQALYQGQALTARLTDTRESMEKAAAEESDHLSWCEGRLHELGSHSSYMNPAWYALSFGLGAAAGIAGDHWSLGFVAETEEQVCAHLQDHLQRLPGDDHRSRAILAQMLIDERHHGEQARLAGGVDLPLPVRIGMNLMSQVMKQVAYRI
jgi:3-demethoxyubiquinol 3-hydroxylase